MITYMDRMVISNAIPKIQEEFGIDDVAVGTILGAFRLSYSLFQIPGGWFGDRVGPRRALTLIVSWWSFFTSLSGLAWNTVSLIVIRFLFGVGEAGAFPIATRSLSRWMLRSERGYAQGITHAGSRLGQALTPPLVVALITIGNWRTPFVLFGILGVAWAALWYSYYRDTPDEHRSVNPAERQLIRADSPVPSTTRRVPWSAILSNSNMWALALMYSCYGWCLIIYQDWLPKYLYSTFKVDLKTMGLLASLPLLAGVAGDFVGGWASDRIAQRTHNLKLARRLVGITGFLIAGISILPATLTTNPQVFVAYTCLTMLGLELTVGVSWAIPLDIGGDYAGSISAVMSTCGNLSGLISSVLFAYLVAHSRNTPFFIAAASCGVAALMFARIDASKAIESKKAVELA
jgi:MFS family permease